MADVDARVRRVKELGSVLRTNTELRRRLEGGPVTKKELLNTFGSVKTESGTVRDILAILPDTQRIENAEALLDLVAEREALAMRTGPGEDLALAAAFGRRES